ncbi:MAG: aminopeptidase [Tannerellaceae bacterium]|jgi:aminopeptidase C|nr:aminopeptidase [Tannerellaceae bacterium]
MKRVLIAGLLLATTLTSGIAQDGEEYTFTPVKELKITTVKNQNRTGTCWSFSGVGYLESELLRMGKAEYDLSEMFIISHSYKDQAAKYIRTHGSLNFEQGGSFEDVLYAVKQYGIVPESVMNGLNYGEDMHVHSELVSAASAYIKAILKNPNGKLSTAWKKGFDGIIDAYLGEIPEKFTYKDKEYTPLSFVNELGLNIDDYVSFTSFTHAPFYKPFALEVPDNWRWGLSYNVPLNELMEIIKHAINTGYTVAWASDVSEVGFNRNGIAVVPDVKAIETSGSDQERWTGLSQREKNEEIRKLAEKPCRELTVTQEMRQEGYDNFQTTDDHAMLIYGMAKDQSDKEFFMVKNSWGTDSKYKGIWYASEAFVAYKTISIVIHKDAIPSAIRNKTLLTSGR